MTTIASLPQEVLFNIFNKFDKVVHLTECRLVCRNWTDPVQRAMLKGRTITISTNEAKTSSLLALLKRNPARAHLIKHLDFGSKVAQLLAIRRNLQRPLDERMLANTRELLLLLVTPRTESIRGHINNDDFETPLTDVLESFDKFNNLKIMELTSNRQNPFKLAIKGRETIQTMILDLTYLPNKIDWNFLGRLNQFKRLTTLTLTAEPRTITALDRILDSCSQLQEFSLNAHGGNVDDLNAPQWNRQLVKKHTNLRALKINDTGYFSTHADYFLYKLINIQKIYLSIYVKADFPGGQEGIVRIPNLIKTIPQKTLLYFAPGNDFNPQRIISWLEEAGYTAVEVGRMRVVRVDF